MCTSTTENCSLKLISLTCLVIMTVDSFVLHQTVQQYWGYQAVAYPGVFDACFKPQLLMRITFTCYAINAALICFLLTLALAFSRDDHLLESTLGRLFSYTYICFGPVLLLISGFGLYNIKGLAFECQMTYVDREQLNMMDVLIVVGSTVFACLITLFYSVQQAIEAAENALRNEKSVIYRIFLHLLKYQRRSVLNQRLVQGRQEGYGAVQEQEEAQNRQS